jgi:tRNA pseudouridine38-40 synthase
VCPFPHFTLINVGNKRNIKLVIAYDGTAYQGWQIQAEGKTIQGTIEKRLMRILGHPARIAGSGRTDAGVHAAGQAANFHTDNHLSCGEMIRALNALLPGDIRILRVTEAPPAFHARKWALSKTYIYNIYNGMILPPPLRHTYYHEKVPLDMDAMRSAAQMFMGTHDFTSFCSAGTTVQNKVRSVTLSRITVHGRRLHYRIRADGFLWHMVRNIVGTLLEIGKGKMPPDHIPALIRLKDRRASGPTAAPHGLTLAKVYYGKGPPGAGASAATS